MCRSYHALTRFRLLAKIFREFGAVRVLWLSNSVSADKDGNIMPTVSNFLPLLIFILDWLHAEAHTLCEVTSFSKTVRGIGWRLCATTPEDVAARLEYQIRQSYYIFRYETASTRRLILLNVHM